MSPTEFALDDVLRNVLERAENLSQEEYNSRLAQVCTPRVLISLLAELNLKDKRISELRGWNVGLAQESFEREQRILELQSRTMRVKSPPVPNQWETLNLGLEPSDGYGMQKGAEYMRDEIIKVLAAHGIVMEQGD